MKCDLHIHTNKSDGILTPTQVVDLAKERGLDCIAITDHDTVSGVAEAATRAKEVGLKFLVGVELSCSSLCEVHMLGYNMDVSSGEFAEEIGKIVELRNERNKLIFEKLRRHGCDIDESKLGGRGGTIGRGVIAREMVRMGFCQSVAEVFDNYLGVDKCCYVQSRRLTPVEGIQFVLKFGGIPVLAHPKKLRLGDVSFERFLKPLVLAGLGGIEAEYFTHTNAERRFYGRMASKYKLITTGGSDFHDYVHGVDLGLKSFNPSNYTRTILGI